MAVCRLLRALFVVHASAVQNSTALVFARIQLQEGFSASVLAGSQNGPEILVRGQEFR